MKRPRTPLPWRFLKLGDDVHLVSGTKGVPTVLTSPRRAQRGILVRGADGVMEPLTADHPDAAYIQEAANGYPHAVAAAVRLLRVLSHLKEEVAETEGAAKDIARAIRDLPESEVAEFIEACPACEGRGQVGIACRKCGFGHAGRDCGTCQNTGIAQEVDCEKCGGSGNLLPEP